MFLLINIVISHTNMLVYYSTSRNSDLYHSVKSYGNYRLPASLQVATLMAGDSVLRSGMQPASAYAPLYYYGYRTPSSVLARVGAAEQPSQRRQPPPTTAVPRPASAAASARNQEHLSGFTVSSAASAPSAARVVLAGQATGPMGSRAAAFGSASAKTLPDSVRVARSVASTGVSVSSQQRQQVFMPPTASRPSADQSAAPVVKPSAQQPVKPPRGLPERSSPPPATSQAAAAFRTEEEARAPKSDPTAASAAIATAVVGTGVRTQIVPATSPPPPAAASTGEFDTAAAAPAGDTILGESSLPAANVSQSSLSQAHEVSYSSNTFEAEEEEEGTSPPSSPQRARAAGDEERAEDAPAHDESPEADAHSRSIFTTSAASENTLLDDRRAAPLPDADADELEEIPLM